MLSHALQTNHRHRITHTVVRRNLQETPEELSHRSTTLKAGDPGTFEYPVGIHKSETLTARDLDELHKVDPDNLDSLIESTGKPIDGDEGKSDQQRPRLGSVDWHHEVGREP